MRAAAFKQRRLQRPRIAPTEGPAAQPSNQAMGLTSAAAPRGSAAFAVRHSANRNRHYIPSVQARAAFCGYIKKPSSVSVPALQRRFSVSVGWSSERFILGEGWVPLLSAAGLRPGDRVRLSRTGDASFKLDTGLDAEGMAEQEAADDVQGAHAARLGGMPCCAVDGHATVWPGTSACFCCP